MSSTINFHRLPLETQLRIWKLAAPGNPLVIKIDYTNVIQLTSTAESLRYRSRTVRSGIETRRHARVRWTIPALLHACHNSRVTALPHCKQLLSSLLHYPVYFNPKQDIFWISDSHVGGALKTVDGILEEWSYVYHFPGCDPAAKLAPEDVRYVATNHGPEVFETESSRGRFLLKMLEHWNRLRKITLVPTDQNGIQGEKYLFLRDEATEPNYPEPPITVAVDNKNVNEMEAMVRRC